MPRILIVDDREEQLESLKTVVNSLLKEEDWEALVSYPLQSPEDYPAFIFQHDVAALLIDARLHEQQSVLGELVGYDGSELAERLRTDVPGIPIFILTAFVDDYVESADHTHVISKDDFADNTTQMVEEIQNRAALYFSEYLKDRTELTDLSKKIAMGEASDDDVRRAGLLQEKLQSRISVDALKSRTEAITEVEDLIKTFSALRTDIENYLQSKS